MGHLPEVDYGEVMDYGEVLWRWLWNLNEYGMCLVNNVPTLPGSVIKAGEDCKRDAFVPPLIITKLAVSWYMLCMASGKLRPDHSVCIYSFSQHGHVSQVCKRIGRIQETLYGKVFELLVKDNPATIANTGEGLPLHMDLLYYKSPPGLSLLHCLRYDDSVIGGESLLLDCYPILEDLKNNYPEQFHTLTRVPATFQSIHHTGVPPTHFIRRVPHVVLGHHEEIVAVNWCPIAEGALQVSPVDVEPYYQAYLLLAKLFNTSERLLKFRLLPGQLISFNNRRILHGRNSFHSKERGGVRHFEGLFINVDESNSQFHLLNNKFGSEPPKYVFNHSVF
ncbi:gamma-butyrobetaine dioxygenase-like isoform X4 [Dysidea avara]|uniref:gamma-butyrobetaine dioxygenase-like isoform X4 n=1 Tax=Dysidea avara TaxID=196820 RepID=UPI00332793E7